MVQQIQLMPRLIQVTRAGGGMLGPEDNEAIMVDAEDIASCVPAGDDDCGNTVIYLGDGSREFVVESVNDINKLVNGN
jgi:hypothetical protein